MHHLHQGYSHTKRENMSCSIDTGVCMCVCLLCTHDLTSLALKSFISCFALFEKVKMCNAAQKSGQE